jgi:hypothetical protein
MRKSFFQSISHLTFPQPLLGWVYDSAPYGAVYVYLHELTTICLVQLNHTYTQKSRKLGNVHTHMAVLGKMPKWLNNHPTFEFEPLRMPYLSHFFFPKARPWESTNFSFPTGPTCGKGYGDNYWSKSLNAKIGLE